MSCGFESEVQIEALGGEFRPGDLVDRLQGSPGAFALESGLDAGGMGRWHIFGAFPIGEFRSCGREWQAELAGASEPTQFSGSGNPWEEAEAWWRRWKRPESLPVTGEGVELPIAGGAVGYWGFELADSLETLPAVPEPVSSLPDLHLQLYDELVVVCRESGRAWSTHRGRANREARRWWERSVPVRQPASHEPLVEVSRSLDDSTYLRSVERIREAIGRGDVYEVNLTRTHRYRGGPDAWELHRRLREAQPVPYAACLPWSPLSVVSASPERFLSRRGSIVETRPIKGTTRWTGDPALDRPAGEALLASEKERAELAMIIDLQRNDLGRVCRPGTIRVVEEAALESYATVQHTVATIRGELESGTSPFDLLRATFPGGSITGAPKIAAIEQIRQLEPGPRSVYTGSIGWLDPSGNLDLSIAIRTVLQFEGESWLALGGAITWDSDPDAELEELRIKGQAILRALSQDQSLDHSRDQ